jgi:putative SOS response-associated peptidase YedK
MFLFLFNKLICNNDHWENESFHALPLQKRSGKEIYSYTIITTVPNEVVGKFHDRMPVILQKEDEETWLNPDIIEPEQLLLLLKPYPADKMEEWHVSDEARNPRNDYPELIKPVNQ